MNISNLTHKGFSARFFAAVTIVSLLLSAFPVAFFVANAADTLLGPTNQTITMVGGEFGSGVIDASAYENLQFSFDYDSIELDGADDSFTYGWRDAGGDNDLGTIVGLAGELPAETDSVSVPLPVGAQVSDLEVYVFVTAVPGAGTDEVELTNITLTGDLAPVACSPQFDAVGATNIQNSASGDYFDSINDALADCDTQDGDTIELLGDITTSEQQTLNREIVIDGNGFTIDAAFTKTDNDNNSALGVQSDDVVIKDIKLTSSADEPWPKQLHGVNAYRSTGLVLESVTATDFEGIGILINGSEAEASDITTSGNGWHAINVDKGSDNYPATLTISETSSHDENSATPPSGHIPGTNVPHIFVDDANGFNTVIDTDSQYDMYEFFVPDVQTTQAQLTASIQVSGKKPQVYTLKTGPDFEPLKLTAICTIGDIGMRFRVQNTNAFPITASYDVVGDADTGVVEVAAAGAGVIKYDGATDGADYTFFDTAVVTAQGTTILNYSYGGEDYNPRKASNKTECPKPEPEPEAPKICSYEGTATYSDPAFKNNGDPVDANRRLIAAVENGVAPYSNFFGKEGNDWQVNPLDFFSLGINGEVVYEFTDKIAVDQIGADIAIWEITGGTGNNDGGEQAEVFVSQDGVVYVSLGVITGDAAIDIAPAGLDFVKFVKLVDQSAGTQGPNGDGFDLDAITIIDGSCDDFAMVHTSKIVCDLEEELPNWSGTIGKVTADTATDWLLANEDTSCRLVDGWEFEWANRSASNPGDAHVGYGGADWTTFTGSIAVPLSQVGEKSFWMREVLPADYIPFGGSNSKNDVSAELYCHKDGLNYDNFDRIDKPAAEGDYYCVAWNVPVEKYSDVTMCKYDEEQNPLAGWQLALLGDEVDSLVVQPDGTTQSMSAIPAGNYALKAEGVYEYRGNTGLLADARFSERQAGDPGFGTYPSQPWREASVGTGGLAVQVNNDLGVLWGSVFNPAHIYYGVLSQAALSDVDFYVYDNAYGDNKGEISVALYNGYTGVTGENGCVTFEDVPYGEYTTEELQKAGWTNISGLGSVVVDEESEVFNVVNMEDIEYIAHCGDGEINQEWEQCEVGDEGCTDYCTLDNQCSDLQLVKITLDPTDSTSFDGSLHLGGAGDIIPNETWFNFDEAGDDSFVATANATDGLAIQRDTVNSKLILGFAGGNSSRQLDVAAGTIMSKGIDFGTVDRAPNPQFKLEDGSGNSFDDVFAKNNLEQSIAFDLRADTGNDGVAVAVAQGDEYDCPECKATVEARIVLGDTGYGTGGDGDLSDEIILGDAGYTTVGFGEWFPISEVTNPGDSAVMISDPNTVTNFDSPADKAGLFVSREDGTVKVAIYGKHRPGGNVNHEWIDARIEVRDAGITGFQKLSGQYKFENHPNNAKVPSNNGFDTASADGTGVDFKMWVDTQSDGFKFDIDGDSIASCEEDTVDPKPQPETYRIDGYKHEVTDSGNGSSPKAGWTIYADNGVDAPLSTTTDNTGYFYFDVEEGDWTITEETRDDWELVMLEQGYAKVPLDTDEKPACEFAVFPFVNTQTTAVSEIYSYHCEFYNEYTEPEGEGEQEEEQEDDSTSTRRSSGGSGTRIPQATPQGLVLGESTTNYCPFLLDYMQMGLENDSLEVTKLQIFLNIFKDMFGGTVNPITGTFGEITDANVKAFQSHYRTEILDPWYNLGIVPHNRPTGFVYKTTLWKINSIVCPDYAVLPEFEGEDLNSNVDLDWNRRD